MRVTLRLLDNRRDHQIVWARRFDRPADDALSAQEEISSEVSAQIERAMLLSEGKQRLARPQPVDDPYDLALRALSVATRLDEEGFARAGDYLARAIALAPDFAAAHAWFASWRIHQICQGWAPDRAEAGAHAVALAERAIVLDPLSSSAFALAGHARAIAQRNLPDAAALHERALELNPNDAVAWALSAITQVYLGETGRPRGAIAAIRSSRRWTPTRFSMMAFTPRCMFRGAIIRRRWRSGAPSFS